MVWSLASPICWMRLKAIACSSDAWFWWWFSAVLESKIGVTIAAKNDYCDSIDIAGSTIAILLLLWTTIAILLRYYCIKHYACLKEKIMNMVGLFCTYGYQFIVWKQEKNFRMIVKVHSFCWNTWEATTYTSYCHLTFFLSLSKQCKSENPFV